MPPAPLTFVPHLLPRPEVEDPGQQEPPTHPPLETPKEVFHVQEVPNAAKALEDIQLLLHIIFQLISLPLLHLPFRFRHRRTRSGVNFGRGPHRCTAPVLRRAHQIP